MPKLSKQKRLTDFQFREKLYEELEKGENGYGHSKTKFVERLRSTYSLHIGRGLQLYDIYYQEWQEINKKAAVEALEEAAKEKAAKALKTKIDELHRIEERIDYCLSIKAGKAFKAGDTIIVATFTDEARFQAEATKLINMKASWQGWNAPIKTASTDTEGNDKHDIDYNKLSNEALYEIINAKK